VPSKLRKSKSDPNTDVTADFWAAGVGAGADAGEELSKKKSLPADPLKVVNGSREGTISTWPKPVSTTMNNHNESEYYEKTRWR